jgi:hypothetical protein
MVIGEYNEKKITSKISVVFRPYEIVFFLLRSNEIRAGKTFSSLTRQRHMGKPSNSVYQKTYSYFAHNVSPSLAATSSQNQGTIEDYL